ncbi:MAG TPA: TIGR03086 family metal-binding protein, partial [Nocardioidaceae bacterium]|nr:TIGR03086 family metal-binding protein [Nocardioidaceae bacterium]
APTPCTDWSVRDVVNHVTGEQLWAPHLLRGESLEQVGDRYDGDVLGAEPTQTWDEAAAGALRAWRTLGGEDLLVHTSIGQIPVEEYAEQMHLDLVVHGWDLARGAGLDADVPADVAAHVLTYVEPRADMFAGSGIFSPPVQVDSTDPGDRLLGLLGRDPR